MPQLRGFAVRAYALRTVFGNSNSGTPAMSKNKIQFQRGMSSSAFIDRYGTEPGCALALERLRWPNGFMYAKSGRRKHSRFVAKGPQYWSTRCCTRCSSGSAGVCGLAWCLRTTWCSMVRRLAQSGAANKQPFLAPVEFQLRRHVDPLHVRFDAIAN